MNKHHLAPGAEHREYTVVQSKFFYPGQFVRVWPGDRLAEVIQ